MTAFDDHERRRWTGRAEAYRRSFARLCAYPVDLLLDAAAVRPGIRLIDVGTGPGTVAARAVGRGADVVAVDAEPDMVAAARRAVPGADVRHAVLPSLPFPDAAFDAAVANFVVNHVGEPLLAVAELRRVVRPGGRVAVTTWPNPQPPLQRLWGDIFDAAGGERPAVMPAVSPSEDFARTADGFAGLLTSAGLADVRTHTVAWTHHTDPEDWWSGPAAGIGALGLLMESQQPATVVRIRQEYDRLTAAYRTPDGTLALPTAALLASGRV